MTILSDLTSRKTNPSPPCLITSASTSRVAVREGEDAFLLVLKGPGSGPILDISWAKGSRQLVGDRYHVGENNNSVHLTLQGITREDEGEYTVTAKNIAGESRSAVYLRIKDGPYDEDDTPIFLRRLNDLAVKVGTRTRFLVEIRSSSDIKVTWHRNDVPVSEEEERFHFLHEGNFFCVDVAPVTIEDGGRWSCVAENRTGRSSCSCRLNVLVPKAYKAPEFLEELKAVLTDQGTVSLECKVVGVPTPVLKWYKDGKEIKPGDMFALTANSDDPTSLGMYTCEATNCMGKAFSSSRVHVSGKGSREGSLLPADHRFAMGPPPVFTRELKDERVKIGSAITLTCQVTVPPWPKSINWYNREGKIEPSEKYHIMEDGLGGYSIEVYPLEAGDEGEWKCVATSDTGVISITKCTISMTYPRNYRKPKFLESLKAILTEEGLVSFECKVVGFPTPRLQWFKDGQELRPGDVYQLTGTNSLGSYSCIARNCMGEAKSTAELTVEDIQSQLNEEEKLNLFSKNQPPRFIRGLKSCEAKINEDFRFTVQVTLSPEAKLTWYRDDEKIESGDRYSIVAEGVGVCHLSVKRLEVRDQAEWKCVASNEFGQSITTGFLKLTIPKHYKKPKFLECLRAILSEEGAVNLECKVIGVPQPVLRWYKDGKELKPGDIHRIISGEDGKCCLGTYTCEAQNCMGTASSSASLLGFEDRKAIKEIPRYVPEPLYPLAKNTSLSTINEERTSQLYDTPGTEHSITMDERGDVSFSFDGKEVSISLYETPDLTEEEALKVVEMYAEELSEHISEQNVVELPPMRFTKESSKSGPLLMEAVVIDVSEDYFSTAEDDLRTEADFEDVSMAEEGTHNLASPEVENEAFFEKINSGFLEKALASLSGKEQPPKKKSSSDSFKSLSSPKKGSVKGSQEEVTSAEEITSDSRADTFASAKGSSAGQRPRESEKEDKPKKKKKSKSRSASVENQNRSFDEKVEEGVVTITPKRTSISRSSSGGSDDKSPKKTARTSRSDSRDLDGEVPKRRRSSRSASESMDETIVDNVRRKRVSRSRSESGDSEATETLTSARKKKKSTPKEGSTERPKPKDEGRKSSSRQSSAEPGKGERKRKASVSSNDSQETSTKKSTGVDTPKQEGEVGKKKKTRSRSSSVDKAKEERERRKSLEKVKKKLSADDEKEGERPPVEVKDGEEARSKRAREESKAVESSLKEIRQALTVVEEHIAPKGGEAAPKTDAIRESIQQLQKGLEVMEEQIELEEASPAAESFIREIARPVQDLEMGLKLASEQTTSQGAWDVFSLVANQLQEQLKTAKAKVSEVSVGLATAIADLITPVENVTQCMAEVTSSQPVESLTSVELLQNLAQPVQDLQVAIETAKEQHVPKSEVLSSLSEPMKSLKTAITVVEQKAQMETDDEDSVSEKILKKVARPIMEISEGLKVIEHQIEEVEELPLDSYEMLSQPIQDLHRGLAEVVQEVLFCPPKAEEKEVLSLQKVGRSVTEVLENLQATETDELPSHEQRRMIFSSLQAPLIALKDTFAVVEDMLTSEAAKEAAPEKVKESVLEVLKKPLRDLNHSLHAIESDLSQIPAEVAVQVNKENILQIVRNMESGVAEVGKGELPMPEVFNALLAPMQDLRANLSDKQKLRHPLSKSSSSLGKSLELIKQGSEEEKTEAEEPKINLSVLRPLEKPLQDLEEGFDLLEQHILRKEDISSREKPVIEGQLQTLLEILSQSFEVFQEKWVTIEANKEGNAAVLEANALLELVKELKNGTETIESNLTELEAISPRTKDLIKGNVSANLKKLKMSIAQVEHLIVEESLQVIPEFKALTENITLVQENLMALQKQLPETKQAVERVVQPIADIQGNLEMARSDGTKESTKPVLDEIVQQTLKVFKTELDQAERSLQKETPENPILSPFKELKKKVDQQMTGETTVEALLPITKFLEEFVVEIQEISPEVASELKPREANLLTEVITLIERNVATIEAPETRQSEVTEILKEPLGKLHAKLEEMKETADRDSVAVLENLIKPLNDLKVGLEGVVEGPTESARELTTEPPVTALATSIAEMQKGIAAIQQQATLRVGDGQRPQAAQAEVLEALKEPLKDLQEGLTKVQVKILESRHDVGILNLEEGVSEALKEHLRPEMVRALESLQETISSGGDVRVAIATVSSEIEKAPPKEKKVLLKLRSQLESVEQELSAADVQVTIPRKDGAVKSLETAVNDLHEGLEHAVEVFKDDRNNLKALTVPLYELGKALEKIESERDLIGCEEVRRPLVELSHCLEELEEGIAGGASTMKVLAKPIAEIKENIAAIEQLTVSEERTGTLPELGKLVQALTTEIHDLQEAVEVAEETLGSEAVSLKLDRSVVKSIAQPVQELQHKLAEIKENVRLESEGSFERSVLETLAEPVQLLQTAVAVFEQQAMETSGTAPSVTFEQISQPIMELHRGLAQIQQQVALSSEKEENLKVVLSVAKPIQELVDEIAVVQETVAMEGDAVTASSKTDVSMLKKLAKPIRELQDVITVVQQCQVVEPEAEPLSSLREPTIAKPLQSLSHGLEQLQNVILEATTVAECASALEAVAKPIRELEHTFAVLQQHEHNTAEVTAPGPDFDVVKKLATPVHELASSLLVVQQHVTDSVLSSLSESQLEPSSLLATLVKPNELEKMIAVIQQYQVMEPEAESMSSAKESTLAKPLQSLRYGLEQLQNVILEATTVAECVPALEAVAKPVHELEKCIAALQSHEHFMEESAEHAKESQILRELATPIQELASGLLVLEERLAEPGLQSFSDNVKMANVDTAKTVTPMEKLVVQEQVILDAEGNTLSQLTNLEEATLRSATLRETAALQTELPQEHEEISSLSVAPVQAESAAKEGREPERKVATLQQEVVLEPKIPGEATEQLRQPKEGELPEVVEKREVSELQAAQVSAATPENQERLTPEYTETLSEVESISKYDDNSIMELTSDLSQGKKQEKEPKAVGSIVMEVKSEGEKPKETAAVDVKATGEDKVQENEKTETEVTESPKLNKKVAELGQDASEGIKPTATKDEVQRRHAEEEKVETTKTDKHIEKIKGKEEQKTEKKEETTKDRVEGTKKTQKEEEEVAVQKEKETSKKANEEQVKKKKLEEAKKEEVEREKLKKQTEEEILKVKEEDAVKDKEEITKKDQEKKLGEAQKTKKEEITIEAEVEKKEEEIKKKKEEVEAKKKTEDETRIKEEEAKKKAEEAGKRAQEETKKKKEEEEARNKVEEEAKKKAEEEAKKKEEEEAKKKALEAKKKEEEAKKKKEEEEAKKKEDEEVKKKAEEDAKKKEEEAAKKKELETKTKEEEEAKKKAEEDAKTKTEEEAKQKMEEEAKKKKEEEEDAKKKELEAKKKAEEEAKKMAEEEAKKKKEEEEAKKKAEEEEKKKEEEEAKQKALEAKKKEEEEAKKAEYEAKKKAEQEAKKKEEETKKKKEEEEAKKKKEEEAKKKAEEEAKKKEEEEAKKKAEEEAKTKALEAKKKKEEEAKKKEEEEAKKKAEEEAKKKAEEEAKKKEEEAKKKKEEEEAKKKAEEEAKKKEEEEAKQKALEAKKKEEEEAKKKEEEAKKKKEEEEAKKKAEEEAKKKEEEEAKKKAEEEAKKKAEEEAKKKQLEAKKKEEEEAKKKEEEAKKKKEEEEAKKKEEEEAKKKAEEEAKKKAEEEAKKKEEEEAKKKAEEEAKKKAEEEAKKKQLEAKKKEEEEAKKKEEEAKKKKEEEEAKKKEEEEAKKKAEEEAKKKAEEEAKKKAEEEAKKKAEEEAKKKAEEEAKKKAEEEAKKKELEAKKKAEEEAKKKAEEEAKKKAEEAKKKELEAKKKAEEEAKKKEEEAKKKKEEEEAKKKAEEEAKKKEEEEAKKKAEEEAKKKELEAKKKAEEEAKKKEEEEAKKKAEEEAKKKEEEAKKKKEEEEAKKKAEEEAKKKEEEAKNKAEEEAKKKEEEAKKKELETKEKEEAKKKKEEETKKKAGEEANKKNEEVEAKKKGEKLSKKKKKEEEENKKEKEREEAKKKEEEEATKEKEEEEVEEAKRKEGGAALKTEEETAKEEFAKKKTEAGDEIKEDKEQPEAVELPKKGKLQKKQEAEDVKDGKPEMTVQGTSRRKRRDEPDDAEPEFAGTKLGDKGLADKPSHLEASTRAKAESETERYTSASRKVADDTTRRYKTSDATLREDQSRQFGTSDAGRKSTEPITTRDYHYQQETRSDLYTKPERTGARFRGIPEGTSARPADLGTGSLGYGRSEIPKKPAEKEVEKKLRFDDEPSQMRDIHKRRPEMRAGVPEWHPLRRPELGRSLFDVRSYEEQRKLHDVTRRELRRVTAKDYSVSLDDLSAPEYRGRIGRETSRDKKGRPVFCSRLVDRTAPQGSHVKLTCTVLGTPEPSIKWLRHGLPLPMKPGDRYRSKVQDGVASLEIESASQLDNGEYTCLAENAHGETTTTCHLRIFDSYDPAPFPPTFVTTLNDTYRFTEDELTLQCRVRSHPPPRIQWLRNGVPIRPSSRYQQSESSDGICKLTIFGPEMDDSGDYTCRAENPVSEESITHRVKFLGRQHYADARKAATRAPKDFRKPHFRSELTDHLVPAGGTIALQVEVRGLPRPEVKWLRGGEELPRASSRVRSFEDAGVHTLLVSNASEKEAGLYSCHAYNAFGHIRTTAAVEVLPVTTVRGGKAPKIVNRPKDIMTVNVDDDVIVTCRVTGDPKPRVSWMKGTKDITITQRTMVDHSDDYYRFTLKKVVAGDAGTYWIIAKNVHGHDRAFVTIQVKQRARSLTPGGFSSARWDWGVPSTDSSEILSEIHDREKYSKRETPGPIGSEPYVADSGRNWLTLSWNKPSQRGAAPVIAYRVDAWEIGQDGGARWTELGITPVNTFDAFNLKQGKEYKFRITPRNRYGWGEPLLTSRPISVGYKAANMPEFTKILPGQLKALLGSSIRLECHVASDLHPQITWYRDAVPMDFASPRVTSSFDGTVCQLVVTDLAEEDSGRYMCEAVNKMGRASTFARLMIVNDPKVWAADANLKRGVFDEESIPADSPPQFTMRLRDRRVQMTYPVRLTCQVVGSPAPDVKWYHDGKELAQDDRHSFSSEDHFHTLEMSKTVLEDAGCYTATARNDHGSVSCRCNLVVDKGIRAYVAPEFVHELDVARTVRCGDELRLTAQVEAYPTVGVVWHRNGVRLRPSRRIVMTLSHDGTVELAIGKFTERDSGVYTCTAANEVGRCETVCRVNADTGTSKSSAVPEIRDPSLPYSKAPIFIKKPTSTEAVEGDTVLIECQVVGDPKPEVIWLRDFLKPDYYKDAPHFRREGDGPDYRLEIPLAKLDYTGTYSVLARNVHGEVKAVTSLQIYAKGQGKEDRMDHSPVTHGKVETLPVFRKGLKDIRCCDGDAVTLECAVEAAKPPEIRWKKGGKLVPLGGDFSADFDGQTARLIINQVYPEDEGEYTCEASNNLGKSTTSACLVVDVPEEKENLLSRQLARPPGLMSGCSTPRSTPRTTPSRSISPYPAGHRYRSTSPGYRPKRLKVTPPKFYAVPHNRIAQEGETVRFQCAIAGHPTPWVTWDKDGLIVTPTARITITEKEDLKILEISEVTAEDAGLYRIVVENEVGRIEATARLDVIGPHSYKSKVGNVRAWSASPNFRRRLVGSVGRIGGNVTLGCDIRSSPNPVTSWYRNGDLVVKTGRFTPTWNGETAMLEITDLEKEDAGVYTCVAENEFGRSQCSAEVVVLDGDSPDGTAPSFVEPLRDVVVEEGSPAELQVRVEGHGPLEVVWSKDNEEVPDCNDFHYVDYGDGRYGLRIADAFIEDSGEYSCEVFNQHGDATSSARLWVKDQAANAAPKIVFSKKPTSAVVGCGRSASFCCRLQCTGSDRPPIVSWSITGREVPKSSAGKYSIEEDGDVSILHVHSAEPSDAGQITCTARYECPGCDPGECPCREAAASCSAELTVLSDNWLSDSECERIKCRDTRLRSLSTGEIEDALPKMVKDSTNYSVARESASRALILRGPADRNIFRGGRVVLNATYCGQPEPQVRWMKGGQQLETGERIRITTGDGVTSLTIDSISSDDSGKYVVCVENEHGADRHFASLAVEGPPEPPSAYPTVNVLPPDSAQVEWSSPAFDGGCKITGYVIEQQSASEPDWKVVAVVSNAFSHVVKNLRPNEKYKFRVRAENVHGRSEASGESNAVTMCEVRDDFPPQFEPRAVTIEDGDLFKAKYEVLEELGKGRFGVVHKVADFETGQKLAAKFIRCITVKDREKVKEEIEIMNCLRHPKLLHLAAAFESPREMVMVMEYISGGELFERVVADDFQLTERDCILFMRQICEGVRYMHENSVVHLDLKPENIMCQTRTSHEIKLIDFGLAQKIDPEHPVRVLFGTPEFVPPEVINYEPIGFESDMWSVGVICYVLLSGLSPFMGENDAETFANITRASYDFDDEAFCAISQDAKDFISSLLVKRKEKRLTASECLRNKWMLSEHDKTLGVILSTDKLKKFIIRRKWQKTGNAIRALGRLATLSAASRRNTGSSSCIPSSQSANKFSAGLIEEEPAQPMDACGSTSSPIQKSVSSASAVCHNTPLKPACKADDKSELRSRLFSERSDSGISDCSSSSIGHHHSCHCSPTGSSLLGKKYSITENDEVAPVEGKDNVKGEMKPVRVRDFVSSKPNSETIGSKVDVIRQKFANLSRNIDEMDKKLETVGRKLVDIVPGKLAQASKPEIKRVPSLKDSKPSDLKRLMQPTASSQAKVNCPKSPVLSRPLRENSGLTVPVSPDLRTAKLSKIRQTVGDGENSKVNSYVSPTVKRKKPEGLRNPSGSEHRALAAGRRFDAAKSTDGKCNSIASPPPPTSKDSTPEQSKNNLHLPPENTNIRAGSLNFQKAVAFWKR